MAFLTFLVEKNRLFYIIFYDFFWRKGGFRKVRHCCADITISHYYFCADNTPASRSELSAKVILRISKAEAGLHLVLSGALPANKRTVQILEIWIFSAYYFSVVPETTVNGKQILCVGKFIGVFESYRMTFNTRIIINNKLF